LDPVPLRPHHTFPTRRSSDLPDTLFGATYMVLAPEHPLVDELVPAEWPEGVDERWTGGAATPGEAVASYRRETSRESELDRQERDRKSTRLNSSHVKKPHAVF